MNLFSTWNGSGSSHPHLRKVKLQSFSQHPSCPSLYYYTLQDSTKSILRFFFFNGEVGMVSVIHWNISAKGQTPVWCPPTPTVPYAWPSTMLNLKHTQESFRCWRKKKKKKKTTGQEFILAWTFLTDFPCWVWTIFKFFLFPMHFLSSMLFVKVYHVSSTTILTRIQKKTQEFPMFHGVRQITWSLCISVALPLKQQK